MERISFWPTKEAAEKQAAFVEAEAPGGTYFVKKMANGEWRLNVEPAADKPTLLYNLELDAVELSALFKLFEWIVTVTELRPPEKAIQEKVIRLMEGR